jgi:hypothetical protein
MCISLDMPWGTIVEMMPDARKSYRKRKCYTGIFLGFVKNTDYIKVIQTGNSTVQSWNKKFWRQNT